MFKLLEKNIEKTLQDVVGIGRNFLTGLQQHRKQANESTGT